MPLLLSPSVSALVAHCAASLLIIKLMRYCSTSPEHEVVDALLTASEAGEDERTAAKQIGGQSYGTEDAHGVGTA